MCACWRFSGGSKSYFPWENSWIVFMELEGTLEMDVFQKKGSAPNTHTHASTWHLSPSISRRYCFLGIFRDKDHLVNMPQLAVSIRALERAEKTCSAIVSRWGRGYCCLGRCGGLSPLAAIDFIRWDEQGASAREQVMCWGGVHCWDHGKMT